jgi:hypothetical protein
VKMEPVADRGKMMCILQAPYVDARTTELAQAYTDWKVCCTNYPNISLAIALHVFRIDSPA